MRRINWLLAPATVPLMIYSGQVKAQYTSIAVPVPRHLRGGCLGWQCGRYYDVNGGSEAFLYNGTTYTTLAVPGAVNTRATGVDAGNVVGYFQASGGIRRERTGSANPVLFPLARTGRHGDEHRLVGLASLLHHHPTGKRIESR